MTSDHAYLLEAASVIEKRGHYKGKLQTDDGRRCFYSALIVAVHGDNSRRWDDSVDRLAALVAARIELPPDESMVMWNDSPSRTAEEVITALRETAMGLGE